MTSALRVRVTGRVQGVFFRAWTREQAGRLGLAGWVRNCADGSVEAHVEGEEHAVEQMLVLLHDGPAGAQVDELTSTEAEVIGAGQFDIRH